VSSDTLSQGSVRRYQEDRRRALGSQGDERVISPAWRVYDLHSCGDALISPAPGRAFQDDDNRRGQSAGARRGPDLFHQSPSRTRTVAPPAGGSGADHVGRIDEQHASKDRARPARPLNHPEHVFDHFG
jgi:hypothetical protein